MGAALGIHRNQLEIREIYESSTLLPLIGADRPDKVIKHAKLRRADEHHQFRATEAQALFIFDGFIDLYHNNQKIESICATRRGNPLAPESSIQEAARRARYDTMGTLDSMTEVPASGVRVVQADEILVYWRGVNDVVCRYACQTGGDEVILKSALGDRIEVRNRTRYVSLATKTLVAKGASLQSINALKNADLVELMGDIPFFANIPRDQLFELTEVSTIRVYPAKSVVFREDEGFSTQMFVTLAGTLEVSSSRASAPLARLEPGSFFGEMSLLINIPRAATVTAVESCLLMSIEKDAFHAFLEKLPNVRASVYKLLKERLLAKALMSGVLPYFNSVPAQRMTEFSHKLTIEDRVRKGDCILDQEGTDDAQKFGLVVYGVLEIVSGETRRTGLRDNSVFLTPGCYFGPFTFERLNYQKGKVFARSPVVLLTCAFSQLKDLFNEFPEVAAEANIAWFGERCDLASVLRHVVLTQRFQAFLEAEHSDENFLFCLDVDKFRAAPRDERGKLAAYIVNRYIQPDSPKEVNLPATIRDYIVTTLKSPALMADIPTTFFNTANDEIMRLMTKDSFPRFKKSPMFQSIVDALDPHLNRKGSKMVDACHAFRESINLMKPGRVEHVAVAKLQRMLSTIRRSHHKYQESQVAATNTPS